MKKVIYVLGFLFSPNMKEVMLISKRFPTDYRGQGRQAWQSGRVNGIGGLVQEGETTNTAMSRKMLAEAGIATQAGDWKRVLRYFDFDKKTNRLAEIRVLAYVCKDDHQFDFSKGTTDEKIIPVRLAQLADTENLIYNVQDLVGFAHDSIKDEDFQEPEDWTEGTNDEVHLTDADREHTDAFASWHQEEESASVRQEIANDTVGQFNEDLKAELFPDTEAQKPEANIPGAASEQQLQNESDAGNERSDTFLAGTSTTTINSDSEINASSENTPGVSSEKTLSDPTPEEVAQQNSTAIGKILDKENQQLQDETFGQTQNETPASNQQESVQGSLSKSSKKSK